MQDSSQTLSVIREVVWALVGRKLRDDDPILSSGLIDSLSILKLIASLENKLGLKIPTAQVQPEDFDSVDYIRETIDRVAIWN
jgi:acyl carrier protein